MLQRTPRFVLRCAPQVLSLARTLPPTPKPFTIVFLTCSRIHTKRKKFKIYLTGGTGESFHLAVLPQLNPFLCRKIFPHTYRDTTPVANSALARIKEKRRAQRVYLEPEQPEPQSLTAEG